MINADIVITQKQNREIINGCSNNVVRKNNDKFGKKIGHSK